MRRRNALRHVTTVLALHPNPMKTVTHRPLRIYAMEASLLGLFMVSACSFGALLEHPASPVRHAIEDAFVRRWLMGIAMGATAVALIYSYPGRRTGAHMNPAVTLSALRLGRIKPRDAAGYIVAQFIGAVLGVAFMFLLARPWVGHPSINYVATLPGASVWVAWLAEATIAFIMMGMSMTLNRFPKIAPYTGLFAGTLVALYITFEAPISGMSLNPARTFGSAFWSHTWTALWIYFTAPVVGMLAAVETGRIFARSPRSLCCKHNHSNVTPCHCPCECIQADKRCHDHNFNTL
jgi:aquaporin Z